MVKKHFFSFESNFYKQNLGRIYEKNKLRILGHYFKIDGNSKYNQTKRDLGHQKLHYN